MEKPTDGGGALLNYCLIENQLSSSSGGSGGREIWINKQGKYFSFLCIAAAPPSPLEKSTEAGLALDTRWHDWGVGSVVRLGCQHAPTNCFFFLMCPIPSTVGGDCAHVTTAALAPAAGGVVATLPHRVPANFCPKRTVNFPMSIQMLFYRQ